MGKVKYLLILASLIICFVMISLVFNGVHLKPRVMVKWSEVDSLEGGGKQMAKFLFPVFKEYSNVVLISQEKMSHFFYKGLMEQAQQDSVNVNIQMGEKKVTENSFVIQVIQLNDQDEINKCEEQESLSCLKSKALKLYKKKSRDPSKTWISMYRTAKNKSIFFFL